MDTIYWHMNATQGGATLHPGVNLDPGAIFTRVQIAHMNTAVQRYMLTTRNLQPVNKQFCCLDISAQVRFISASFEIVLN